MVLWKNILPHICHHVVQVDIPEIKDWPAPEPGMEISLTNQYDQFVIGNGDGNIGLAFLAPDPPKGCKGKFLFIKLKKWTGLK